MTTFVFKDPSGRTHEVTGPAGATKEQAFGILQQQLASAPAPAPAAAPRAPAREETPLDERIAAGFMDPIVGAGQIMEKTGVPGLIRKGLSKVAPDIWSDTSMDEAVKSREAAYVAPEGIDWGRIAGNVANPINFVAPEAGVAGKALQAAGPVGRAVATGAAQSALAPVDPDKDFLTEKAKQMALGGGVSGVASKVLPKVLGGMRLVDPTEAAKRLQAKGISLSPGQAAGGVWNDLEQKATSLPAVGDLVRWGRNRGVKEFQEKAVERTGVSPEAAKNLDTARDAISEMYQDVVPKLRATGEAEFQAHGAVAKAGWNPELTKANRDILEGIHEKLFGKDGDRYMKLSGDALKDLDTELGALARKYEKSVLPSDHTLGEEIRNMQQAMREGWRHHLGPEDAALLDKANAAHRRMLPIESAASQRGDEIVTPRALQRALAKQAGVDPVRLKDPLVRDAVKVLSNSVPDSGTAGRIGIPGAVIGLATGAAAPLPVIAGLGAAGAAYSRTGSNILTGNTAVQKALSRTLEKGSPQARKALAAALRAHQSKQVNQEEQ